MPAGSFFHTGLGLGFFEEDGGLLLIKHGEIYWIFFVK